MLLDADVICCKKFTQESFFQGNRSVISYGKAKICYDWPKGSALVLGIPPVGSDDLIMTITPNIFAKEIVKNLLDYIYRRYDVRAEEFLLRNTQYHWSEYTLYYLYAVKSKMFHTFHVPIHEYPSNVLLSKYSLWRESTDDDLTRIRVEDIIQENAYFLVVQSTSKFTPGEIGRKFAYFIT